MHATPAIAQLVEHLTVDLCSNQMVPGSIPGGRIYYYCARWEMCLRANQSPKHTRGKGRTGDLQQVRRMAWEGDLIDRMSMKSIARNVAGPLKQMHEPGANESTTDTRRGANDKHLKRAWARHHAADHRLVPRHS